MPGVDVGQCGISRVDGCGLLRRCGFGVAYLCLRQVLNKSKSGRSDLVSQPLA